MGLNSASLHPFVQSSAHFAQLKQKPESPYFKRFRRINKIKIPKKQKHPDGITTGVLMWRINVHQIVQHAYMKSNTDLYLTLV
jgi:hypothetical protein